MVCNRIVEVDIAPKDEILPHEAIEARPRRPLPWFDIVLLGERFVNDLLQGCIVVFRGSELIGELVISAWGAKVNTQPMLQLSAIRSLHNSSNAVEKFAKGARHGVTAFVVLVESRPVNLTGKKLR